MGGCFILPPPSSATFTISRRRRHKQSVLVALNNLFQALETDCAEPPYNPCGASVQSMRRHCDTCTSAMWHLYIGHVAPVHRPCGTCTSAMWHRYIGHVQPVDRSLFVICHPFVVTPKRLCTKAFSAVVTNKQIKTKNSVCGNA